MLKTWKDLSTFSINTLRRCDIGFPLDKNNNPLAELLSGEWLFSFFSTVDKLPANFLEIEDKNYNTITIPSNWQLRGYGIPIYTNMIYPYAIGTLNPFRMPYFKSKLCPVGVYKRNFHIANLEDEYIMLFEGINSAGEVYVNNQFVGYSEDSFLEVSYNITPFIKLGINTVTVLVYQYSTGSYLEDQDMWRLSGIFRDVYLVRCNKNRIDDIFARCKLINDYKDAELLIDIELRLIDLKRGKLKLKLLDNSNVVLHKETVINSEDTYKISIAETVKKVNKWSNENPYLYQIIVDMYDNDDKLVDRRIISFGFRAIEIHPFVNGRGPFILLNGMPLKIRGINRHEFHPDYGQAVPKSVIEEDIKMLLRDNITSIRTSHYPNCRYFYDMCDKYGILVMSECNLETHGLAHIIPRSKDKWAKACIYRLENMVNSFKNHPSIIMWSLGNESGVGNTFIKMHKAAKSIDISRPVHYECMAEASDILSSMYVEQQYLNDIANNKPFRHSPNIWNLKKGNWLKSEDYKDKPFILCEYAHAMGNSLGNFVDYWNDFNHSDRLCGGYIWDFSDQSLRRIVDGKEQWTYGGDWGDKPNDTNFCFNGIYRADRSPNPALYEVKHQYAMVGIEYNDNVVTLYNKFLFTDLNKYVLRVDNLHDGIVISSNYYNIPAIKPLHKGSVNIKLYYNQDSENTLIFSIVNPNATSYSDKNHTVAYQDFLINKLPMTNNVGNGKVNIVKESDELITISSAKIQVEFSKANGYIKSIQSNGKELLLRPIKPCFWRAVTDNDRVPRFEKLLKFIPSYCRMRRVNSRLKVNEVNINSNDNRVTIKCDWKDSSFYYLNTIYTVDSEGIVIDMECKCKYDMVRYGFVMGVSKDNDTIEFYGRGAHENYIDRKASATLARYKGSVEDYRHNYLYPQENGNHCDVRWLKVAGLEFHAIDKPFQCTVSPYSIEDLEQSKHLHKLHKSDCYYVNIDGMQKGVGGDIPAMAALKPQYKIAKNAEYILSFRIGAINK